MATATKRYLNRSTWLKLHSALALGLGLIFVLIGVTGSLSVYRDEIDQLLNPELVIEESSKAMLSPDLILVAVRANQPSRHGVWTLEMPRSKHGVITAWFDQPKETIGEFYAPLMVAVNPYTGQVISSRLWGETFATWVVDLHSHLLSGASGRIILAILAVLLCVSVISGIILWWPTNKVWATAFSIRHRHGLLRFLTDSHKLIGLLSAPGLLLLAFTGFHLAYPPFLQALTASQGMGHGDEGGNVRSTAIPNSQPVNLQQAVLIARGPFPSSEVRRISTPRGDSGTYRINLKQRQEINQHHPLTMVWIDRWSGQIRQVQNPASFSFGQTITAWLWPIHTGEAIEKPWLWCVVGLMPLVLYTSGLWIWLIKHQFLPDQTVDLMAARDKTIAVILKFYQISANKIWKLWLAYSPNIMAWLRKLGN